MPTKLFAIAALLFGACATDEVPPPTEVLAQADLIEYVAPCEPIDDDPCECDADRVFYFVHEGQCVTVVCDLDNGGCR